MLNIILEVAIISVRYKQIIVDLARNPVLFSAFLALPSSPLWATEHLSYGEEGRECCSVVLTHILPKGDNTAPSIYSEYVKSLYYRKCVNSSPSISVFFFILDSSLSSVFCSKKKSRSAKSDKTSSKGKSKKKSDKVMENADDIQAIGGKDASLFLFRALGKILYCKSKICSSIMKYSVTWTTTMIFSCELVWQCKPKDNTAVSGVYSCTALLPSRIGSVLGKHCRKWKMEGALVYCIIQKNVIKIR